MPRTQLTDSELKSALPDVSSTLNHSDLDGGVRVYRDRYGVPHVQASTTHDAFFGQGFATAQDRMWHMECDRRWAYGTWAEIVGESGVEQDRTMRKFLLADSARRDYEAANDETRAMFDAYAQGVNAFISTTESLPIEFTLLDTAPERWRPEDCIAVFKARHVLMGHLEAKLWRARTVAVLGAERAAAILPQFRKGELLIVPPGVDYDGDGYDVLSAYRSGAEHVDWMADGNTGSNNWAVHGTRTVSGKPLLAGDPHRPLDTPGVYYQNHIACPEFDAIGLSFPGCPSFPHFGHNERVAWCVTHAAADYQDLYIERFDADAPDRYEVRGDWKQAEVRRETIQVKDAESVEIDITITHHGPVVAGDPKMGRAITMRYTATDGPNPGFNCLLKQLRALSVDEADEAMRDWVDPAHNYVMADVDGNIGYLNRGKLPIRTMENAWLPVPGWTGKHEWDGFVPFEDLLRIRNPKNGFIVTANNKQVEDDYPHYVSVQYAPEHRARRIYDRLAVMTEATVADMASVHAESVSLPARTYLELLGSIAPLDDLSREGLDVLKDWDGSMDRDGVAPTIYSAFRFHLDSVVLRNAFGPLASDALAAGGRGAPMQVLLLKTELARMAERDDTSLLPTGATWSGLIAQALSNGMQYLENRLGRDTTKWTWGSVHATQPLHKLSALFPTLKAQLEGPSIPLGGDGDTPMSAGYHASNPFTITGTSVARYVFDTADWDDSVWVVPLGASGHPGSPHFADQARIWGEVDFIPMRYSWPRIEDEAASIQVLQSRSG